MDKIIKAKNKKNLPFFQKSIKVVTGGGKMYQFKMGKSEKMRKNEILKMALVPL